MSFDLLKKFIGSLHGGSPRLAERPAAMLRSSTAGLDCAFRENCRNAVHCEVPSKFTQKFLVRNDLLAQSRNHPDAFVDDLEAEFQRAPSRDILLVLAEMSFIYGKEPSDRRASFFLSCAFYAYKFLLDQSAGTANPYASTFLLARELYNHALSRLLNLAAEARPELKLTGAFDSLAGPMELRLLHNELPWAPERYDEFHSAYDLQPFGFLSEWRQEGLGVPLLCARLLPDDIAERSPEERFLPPWQVHAATGFLRFDNLDIPSPRGAPPRQVGVELRDPMKATRLTVDGQDVPLEIDFTSTLAFSMGRGMFVKNLEGLLGPESAAPDALAGLYSYLPYDRAKIPVVFIHGQTTSPRAWDQMFNALLRNPRIRERYQFCFFFYRLDEPVVHSAHALRRSLLQLRQAFDPDGASPAFNHMVLVAHSLGGLLAKCCVCSNDDAEAFAPAHDAGSLAKDLLVFKPLPFVKRVVYIATPHQGGAMARELLDAAMLRRLDSLPRNPATSFHSIIGNVKADDADDMTDSVVDYKSAHLDYTASEKLIRSNHLAHKHPAAILEVERILVESIPPA